MARHFTATLTGNMGSEARIITTEERTFAAFSLATTDSYKDKNDEWQENETQWHNILVFSPKLIEMAKSLKKGTRIQLQASCYYRPFQVVNGDGEVFTKMEVSFVPFSIELAPLVKKKKEAETA